jgi:hypothetical protein
MKTTRQTFRRVLVLAALGLAGSAIGCRAPSSSPPPSAPVVAPPPSTTQSAPAEQQGSPIQPDSQLTPGATLAVTTDDICVPGYTQVVRDVPAAVKRQVYAEYGIAHHAPGEYEVDHLISLELGGSNSIRNLWPQSYRTQPWNAHVKDALEDELHRLVCSGQLDLKTAQHDIARDWIEAYKHYFHTDRPLASSAHHRRQPVTEEAPGETAPAAAPIRPEGASSPTARTEPNHDAGGDVWVNTRSGKYFRSGSRYYGKTKAGEYLPEAEARQRGYTAARGD